RGAVKTGLLLGGVALAVCVAVASGAGPARIGVTPAAGRAPRLLSETGLYRADGTVDPRNRPFEPQYPLWSDGAAKARWVRLPEGATIDVSDVDAWRFPPGTTFWKEFSWGGRKVETRMIHLDGNGDWTFAAYVWNDEQSDAVLAPEEGVPAHLEIAPGKRHSIPGVEDCHSCHRSAPTAVLGFTALQLSDDRDPLAPHAAPVPEGGITLRTLVEEGRLSPPRPDLARRPPRIRESDPVARAAVGYLSANCGGCHNTRGPLARLGLSLLHDEAGARESPEPAAVTAVASHGRFVVPGHTPDSSFIVAPGAPDRSALVHRMKSRRPSSQMPPLGTVIRDEEAIDLVRRWIEGLRPSRGESAMAGEQG
ncbi:MAG TPA: hypothetical protein VFP58_01215, partial [Candidatus Eisenbacteria bacterium]|nr:hypothetical protein [Candidatus Eisenbacteria bacterium]